MNLEEKKRQEKSKENCKRHEYNGEKTLMK